MAAILQVVIGAQNQTGPAFAQARANVASLATATTGMTAAQRQQATEARQLAVAQRQVEQAQLRVALSGADAAGRVRILTAEHNRLQSELSQSASGTLAYANAQRQALGVQNQLIRAQQQAGRAAGGGGGAAVLPRTFAGFTGAGALQGLGALGVAASVSQIVGQMGQLASEGQRVQAQIDSTRASLAAQIGSVEESNQIWAEATQFANRYQIAQSDLAEAIRASSQIIRTSSAPTEDLLSVLGRLQVLSPEQGLQGAALALRELSSGDIISLVDRFEIARDQANLMKREIQQGGDAVQVLGRYLDQAGITDQALESGLAGAAGETRAWAKATEDLGLAIADVARAGDLPTIATGVVTGATTAIRGVQRLGRALKQEFEDMTRGPIQDALGGLKDVNEVASDWLEGQYRELWDFITQAADRHKRAISATGEMSITAGPRDAAATAAAAAAPARQTFAGFAPPVAPMGGGRVQPQVMAGTPQMQARPFFGETAPRGGMTNVYVTVQGNVTAERDLADTVMSRIEERKRYNAYTQGPDH